MSCGDWRLKLFHFSFIGGIDSSNIDLKRALYIYFKILDTNRPMCNACVLTCVHIFSTTNSKDIHMQSVYLIASVYAEISMNNVYVQTLQLVNSNPILENNYFVSNQIIACTIVAILVCVYAYVCIYVY